MRNKTLYVARAGIIAALYAALTIGQNFLLPGTASMAVQFRISEVMTIFAFFAPEAIPGLTIGCVVANISSVMSGLGFYDMIFGSCASLFAVLAMYGLRNLKFGKIPFIGLLMPAIFNGLIVGFEIDFFFIGNLSFNFVDFLYQGGCVALGELGVLFVLGIPLYLATEKSGLKNLLQQKSYQ